ncbi:MAG: hypothetical protein AB7V43_11110 [Acidimicrobiia bacterium]
MPEQHDLTESDFNEMLRALDGNGIEAIAGGLDALVRTIDDGERLTVMISIDRAVRSAHKEREAAGAARAARDLVVWAAQRDHLDVEARPVVEVTRTAADVARSLVAGESIGERAMRHLSMWLSLFRFRPDDDGLWLPA